MNAQLRIRDLERAARSRSKRQRQNLTSALHDADPMVRGRAVGLLAEMGDVQSARLITELLGDDNAEVRYDAAQALENLLSGSKRAPIELLKLLKDQDALVRVQALDALAAIDDKGTARTVAALLRDSDALVRAHAAECIADLDGHQQLSRVRAQAHRERSPLAQVGFLDALYRLGGDQFLEPLIRKLASKSYRVRCAAANSLNALELKPEARQSAISALRAAKRTPIAKADLEAVTRALGTLRSSSKGA